jgi:hypothetical protein
MGAAAASGSVRRSGSVGRVRSLRAAMIGPGSGTSQCPKPTRTIGCLQAPTANRSGASCLVLLGAVSKQQREFGRLPQSPRTSSGVSTDAVAAPAAKQHLCPDDCNRRTPARSAVAEPCSASATSISGASPTSPPLRADSETSTAAAAVAASASARSLLSSSALPLARLQWRRSGGPVVGPRGAP